MKVKPRGLVNRLVVLWGAERPYCAVCGGEYRGEQNPIISDIPTTEVRQIARSLIVDAAIASDFVVALYSPDKREVRGSTPRWPTDVQDIAPPSDTLLGGALRFVIPSALGGLPG